LLDKYRQERLSTEPWVVLCLDPMLLSKPYTKFSPSNAAHDSGRHVVGGVDAFEAMFAERVANSRGSIERGLDHRRKCPTDLQAEVLIHGDFSLQHVNDVVTEHPHVRDLVEQELESWPGQVPGLHSEPWFFDVREVLSRIRGQ